MENFNLVLNRFIVYIGWARRFEKQFFFFFIRCLGIFYLYLRHHHRDHHHIIRDEVCIEISRRWISSVSLFGRANKERMENSRRSESAQPNAKWLNVVNNTIWRDDVECNKSKSRSSIFDLIWVLFFFFTENFSGFQWTQTAKRERTQRNGINI